MNQNFSRIISLLRKERGLSQKAAAENLDISQALLSHYEKGIRECGLDFVIKVADFYSVSCDYLLGRCANRSGATIAIDDIPETDILHKDSKARGSMLPVLNKKLLTSSINIIYNLLQDCSHRGLTTDVSTYLSASVYKTFRIIYSANKKNPQGMFAVPESQFVGLANSAQCLAETRFNCLLQGETLGDIKGLDKSKSPVLSPEIISEKYPLFSTSLLNLIQNTENKIYTENKSKKYN